MNPSSKPISVSPLAIVVGLTFSDAGGRAFDQAARLARHIPNAVIHLIHVAPARLSDTECASLEGHLELYANQKAASLGGMMPRSIGVHLRWGSVDDEILTLAREVSADLIVLGSEHRGLFGWTKAHVATRVFELAACPVLIAGPPLTLAPVADVTIEPPCPDCLLARSATGGATWWCARHAEHARAMHTYSYQREYPFATPEPLLGAT